MAASVRDQLVALYMVGRNFREIQEFGRILTEGERRELARLDTMNAAAYRAGMDHASNGGKLKHNPHPGGSPEWWNWNNGYKASKKIAADLARQKQHTK